MSFFRFSRYTPPSRRAIFYAREFALNSGAQEIDSTHLLRGLLMDGTSRANALFKLSERFPEETAQMRSLKRAADQRDVPLSHGGKRVLVLAENEANQLDSYWIDTDHLTLGLLAEGGPGASKLETSGLKITESRQLVRCSASKLDSFGPVPFFWQLAKPISRVGRVAGTLYLALIFILIELLTGRGCGAVPGR